MAYEKKYWSEGEFIKADGTPYKGYVGIENRDGYIYDTHELLTKKDSYLTQFNSSSKFFDRRLDEELKLPHTKKEIQFQANDFLYHGTIKQILLKLQANNDYIYQQATISDTLIPSIDDCTIFATTDNSYQVFEDAKGYQYASIPQADDPLFSQVRKAVQDNLVANPTWDGREEILEYVTKPGERPKSQYPAKYAKIPCVKLNVDLDNGVLTRYSLQNKRTTRTALDPTFYPSGDQEALYDFNQIVNAEAVVTKVGTDPDGSKKVKLLLFIAFKDKFIVLRHIYYPENFNKNMEDSDYKNIDFNPGSSDILVIDTVDPANKNTLNFLSIKDIKVKGNYLYLVDSVLNMALRYDITFLKEEDGQIVWDQRSIRLIDTLQGDGGPKDKTYFNGPVSIDSDDDFIYIADAGNHCIKKYSSSFDYVATIKNGPYANHDIQTVQVNPYQFNLDDGTTIAENSLWIFSVVNQSLYVTILSKDRVVYSKRIEKLRLIDDRYTWKEEFRSVKFSFTHSNYYYISTTKRVYKLHVSKPNYPFASLSYFKQRVLMSTMVWSKVPFRWHLLPNGEGDDDIDVTWSYRPPTTSAEVLDNKCFCLCGVDSSEFCDEYGTESQFNGDIIFHIGNLYNQSKIDTYCKRNNCTFNDIPKSDLSEMVKCSGIFLYNETPSWLSSMSKLGYSCFISEEINNMNSSEYVNPITFNKMMYKVIFNLINIKNTLLGKFWGYYNIDGLMSYDQMEYDDFFQNMRIEKSDDFFIHDNEPTSIVINRIFEKIYDIQEKFINHMATLYRAQGAFTNSSFRII